MGTSTGREYSQPPIQSVIRDEAKHKELQKVLRVQGGYDGNFTDCSE